MQFLFYAWKNFIDMTVNHHNRDSLYLNNTFGLLAFYYIDHYLSSIYHLEVPMNVKMKNKNPYMNVIKRSELPFMKIFRSTSVMENMSSNFLC